METEMLRSAALVVATTLLGGCALIGGRPTPLPDQPIEDPYSKGLEQAANDISDSLRVLAETKNADTLTLMPPDKREQVVWQSNYTPPGMDARISLDWVGPVDPVLKMISEAADYDYRIIGKKPVVDHFIRLKHQSSPAIDILRDAGVQVGSVAEVVVFPSTRLIELRYHRDQAEAQVR